MNHKKIHAEWIKVISDETRLVTNNYILVETFALAQHRFGLKAARVFQEEILPIVDIEWIDEAIHKMGISALFAASRKKLSLVDCISFETMRKFGINTVLTLDSHFHKQGFKCIPAK